MQIKGNAHLVDCKLSENAEGVLIQSSGSVVVKNCEVFNNRANGIFVGYDHSGIANIVKNKVHDNQFKGIILGTGGRNKRIHVSGNKEYGNRGLPPIMPTAVERTRGRGLSSVDLRRWAKSVKKRGGSSVDESRNSVPSSMFEAVFDEIKSKSGTAMADLVLGCAFCNKEPEQDSRFDKCAKCKAVCYCSRDCQIQHWKGGHKRVCTAPQPKHPSFIDPNMSG